MSNALTKVKYKLVRFEKAIALQFLWLDPSVRGRFEYKAKDMKFVSSSNPDINNEIVYAWGSDSGSDLKVLIWRTSNNEERDVMRKKIISTIREACVVGDFWANKESTVPAKETEDQEVFEY